MSVTYDKNAVVYGIPVTRYRDVIKEWDRLRHAGRVAALAKLDIGPEEVAFLIDDAETRGFFEVDERGSYDFTLSGGALLSASPSGPIPRVQAMAILDGLLARAAEINRLRRRYLLQVDRIWLFGSLAKGAEMVNDVDVVVETSWTDHGKSRAEIDANDDRLIEEAIELGGWKAVYSRICPGLNARSYLIRRLLNGVRRHPRLARSESVRDLIAMGEPCRLVFDVSRGGRINGPLLERHPDSTGRDPAFPDRRIMPDLRSPPPLCPVSFDVIEQLRPAHLYRRPLALTGHPSEAWTRNGTALSDWIGRAGPFDPRSRSALIFGLPEPRRMPDPNLPGAGLLVERRLDGSTVELRMVDSAAAMRPPFDQAEAAQAADLLALAARCDLHKARRRGLAPEMRVVDEIGTGWSAWITSEVRAGAITRSSEFRISDQRVHDLPPRLRLPQRPAPHP